MDILDQIENFLLDCKAAICPIMQKAYTEFTETTINFNTVVDDAQIEFETDIDTFKCEQTEATFIFSRCEEFKTKSLSIASKAINKEIKKILDKFKTETTDLRTLINGTIDEVIVFKKETKRNIDFILDSKSMSPTEMGQQLTEQYGPAMEVFQNMKEEFGARAKVILDIQETTSRDIDTALNTLANKCKMKYDDIADVYKKCCNAAVELFLADITGDDIVQIF